MSALFRKLLRNDIVTNPVITKRYVKKKHCKFMQQDVQEIKIPVPWGHIAGKWWGDKHACPVLAIHGWQDNANTFDKLIPLLNLRSVLAIDLPGHGLSSHLPLGNLYDFGDHVILLHRIKNHFNWEKVSLLTHSFGGALGYAYTSCVPDQVRWLINIECLRAPLTVFRSDLSAKLSIDIDEFINIENQKKEGFATEYKLSELLEMYLDKTVGNITSPEDAFLVLKRNICEVDECSDSESMDLSSIMGGLVDFIKHDSKVAMSHPEKDKILKRYTLMKESLKDVKSELEEFYSSIDKDKYYTLTKDPANKIEVFQGFGDDFIIEASKHIKCPVLSVRAENGMLYGSTKNLYEKTLEILKNSSQYLEHHEIEGTHYVHLNDPDCLAPVINEFLEKCK